MMKENGVWLSAQPILDDEDGLKFENPISTAMFTLSQKKGEHV